MLAVRSSFLWLTASAFSTKKCIRNPQLAFAPGATTCGAAIKRRSNKILAFTSTSSLVTTTNKDQSKRSRLLAISTRVDAAKDQKKEEEADRIDHSDEEEQHERSPWRNPDERVTKSKRGAAFRSRQHVNPLARRFQQPTVLPENWPKNVFRDLSKPLFLDIGCSRGGFLIDMATNHTDEYNYLGLEIRPIVVQHAKERIAGKADLQGHLEFVGCNANVDLDRLLARMTTERRRQTVINDRVTNKNDGNDDEKLTSGDSSADNFLQMVTIQFPDPHFKARHAKRRVVDDRLVLTLARFMPPGGTVFLQSDIQSVLDGMRQKFWESSEFFRDSLGAGDEESSPVTTEYEPENIFGMPTERESSVLERGLPVYRAKFTRTERNVAQNIETI